MECIYLLNGLSESFSYYFCLYYYESAILTCSKVLLYNLNVVCFLTIFLLLIKSTKGYIFPYIELVTPPFVLHYMNFL